MEQPAPFPKGHVAEVQRPGIMLDDKPIQAAQVIVASEETPTNTDSDEASTETEDTN